MNTILIIGAIVCAIIGILGAVVPGLPGPPVSWVALLLLFFMPACEMTTAYLIVMGVAAAIITVIDYVVPGAITKRMGGTKGGTWGCNIGLVVSLIGLPFGPTGILGVIFWPFVGAYIGEIINKQTSGKALQSAIGALLGLLTGTVIKLIYGIIVAVYICKELIF